jgi:elongation factor P hydroxylase
MINRSNFFHVNGKHEITHLDVETSERQRQEYFGHVMIPGICRRKICEA